MKVPQKLWRSYNWQIKNRIKTLDELERFIKLLPEEVEGIKKTRGIYPMAITPYYLSLIDPEDPSDPIRIQAIPRIQEVQQDVQKSGEPNPFNEESLIPGLTHRYPDRVLLSVTTFCPVYCRHCMRKRIFEDGEKARSMDELEAMFKYIESREEVNEVIISGGEPLSLGNEKLSYILSRIKKIKHIQTIRIGTRMPVLVPQRFFDDGVLDILEMHQPLWISTHFNHPREITELSEEAVDRILRRGIPVVNQTVLLKGVNDDKYTILNLMRSLLRIKVKPQYLFHCDPVKGAIHFRTRVDTGIEIMRFLRGKIGGIGIPTYAIDLPEGKGKVPILPDYIHHRNGNNFVFEAFNGELVEYTIDEVR